MIKAVALGYLSAFGTLFVLVLAVSLDAKRPDRATPGTGFALCALSTLIGLFTASMVGFGFDSRMVLLSSFLAALLMAIRITD